jgi:hypothetical protein
MKIINSNPYRVASYWRGASDRALLKRIAKSYAEAAKNINSEYDFQIRDISAVIEKIKNQ